jgi:hypothetical protein
MMKKALSWLSCALLIFIWGEVYADGYSGNHTISIIEVDRSDYYISSTTGAWDVTGCPSTFWLWISKSDVGSAQALALAIAAKASGWPLMAYGICAGGAVHVLALYADYH